MRRQKGLHRKIATGLPSLLFFLLFINSPALCRMGEKEEGEKREKEKKNQLMVLPLVYYTPETGIAGGAGGIYYLWSLKDRLKGRPSTFFADIIYTQEKQSIFEITPDLYLKKGRLHLVGYAGFKNYTERFYGLGPQTTEDMEEYYSYRSIKLNCSLRNRIHANLYVGIQVDFEHFKFTGKTPGGMLDADDILGNERGTLSGLGILLVQDSRDNIFFPTSGILLNARASFFDKVFGSDYNFQMFNLDFRQYVTVFSKHVLALQESVHMTAGSVPFSRLPMLGGSSVMRGFIRGRYRDKHAMFFQMEYRVPLLWRLSVAGFAGYGDVADTLNRFRLTDLKAAGGLGIRFRVNPESGTNVRLDFGFARGNFGVYAMINEAF